PVGEPLIGHVAEVNAVAFSPDGCLLATGSGGGGVRLWDTETHNPVGEPLRYENAWIYTMAFSPDGCLLAIGDGGGSVQLLDAQTHNRVGRLGPEGGAHTVAFSPDGRFLAASGWTAQLWDIQTLSLVGEPFARHGHLVNAVAFSPEGRLLATGSGDGTVQLWAVTTHASGRPHPSP
ncbi:WD40 repeat domain-containing protein, partial [Streptomyces puniciscabiei]|uniref:WD40 repeat domain-containing protein n=1 Tax=Streptomyces puniciscabiei TaxID=164348 RepID=UPI00334646E7